MKIFCPNSENVKKKLIYIFANVLAFSITPLAWEIWTRSGSHSSCLLISLDWKDTILILWLEVFSLKEMQIGIHFFQVTFLVTVKTNYRTVAYHNWAHGFHVCNSIYSILKASPGIYNPYEVYRGLQAVKLMLLMKYLRPLAYGLEQFVMILTTEGSTTSS